MILYVAFVLLIILAVLSLAAPKVVDFGIQRANSALDNLHNRIRGN